MSPIAGLLIVNSPNWPKVRDQFFDPEQFRAAWPTVLRGFWVDVQMFGYALLAIPVLAHRVRTTGDPLDRTLAEAAIRELLQAIPVPL